MSRAARIDLAQLRELQAAAGADFVAELVQTLADEGPPLIAELRAAQAEAATERFRRAAHSLKSNARTFGATHLAELARRLELGGLPADTSGIDALAAEFRPVLRRLRELVND